LGLIGTLKRVPQTGISRVKKKKRGKPLKFGKHDAEIITYLRAIRKAGGKVNRTVVQGAAFGIVLRRRAPH